MKNLFLLTILGFGSAAYAVAAGNGTSSIECRLTLQQTTVNKTVELTPTITDSNSARSVLAALSSKKMLTETELRRLAEASKKLRLDKIVGALEKGTANYTLQDFEFDDNQYPIKRTNAYWNPSTEEWDPEEIYEYVWDEDGYCSMQQAYTKYSGLRYEYEYNDRKLGIVQIQSAYDGSVWTPQSRGDYQYDNDGNMTEEILSSWDAASSSWIKVIRNTAAYDDQNRQVDFATYEWTGAT